MICLLFSRERLTGKLLCGRRLRGKKVVIEKSTRFTVRGNRSPNVSFLVGFFISCCLLFPPPVANAAGWPGGEICGGRKRGRKRDGIVRS